MIERLSDRLKEYLSNAIGREVNLRDIRAFLRIEPGSKDDMNLRTQMATTMIAGKIVKASGRNDGIYKVLIPIRPVEWWVEKPDEQPLNFRFPKSHIDDTGFDIEDLVEIFAGDLILISGQSNYGKTCLTLNLLAENISLFSAGNTLMGSEYTACDDEITPKFKRRMQKMDWVQWIVDGKPRFQLLPIGGDYEDYVVKDNLNLIDWISLGGEAGEYYLIDRITKKIKDRVGRGVVVAVLQKNKDAEHGEGGERSVRYVDLELKIDRFSEFESLLTIGKVKAPKKRGVEGRTWAFGIQDYGANLIDIREVVRCVTCWGKGYTGNAENRKRCPSCEGRKYVNKEGKVETKDCQ